MLVLAGALAATLCAQPDQPAGPPGPGGFGPGGRGFGPPGMQGEIKLVAKFDRDGDGRLNADERKAARESLASTGGGRGPGGRGFRGGPGGRGAPQEPAQPGVKLTAADVKLYGTEPLYDPTVLRTLFIEFADADWEKEMEAFNNTDVDVPATLTVDGRTFRDVGIHFRGASSYFMVPTGYKRSLNVTLDFAHPNQNLLGHRTLNLLNSHEDASFLHAPLFSRIAQDYLPAPKVNFVRVVINGENWGIYASAEQFNKDFVKDRFNATKGARWKVPGSPGGRGSLAYLGENIDAYRGIYEIKTKDDEKSWRHLIRMMQVLNDTPPEKLEAELSPLLDIDGALRFLALDLAVVNGDGYWTRTSDYSIAEDDRGQLHLVPHDMNEAFSPGGGGPAGRGPGGPRGRPGGFGGPPPGAGGPDGPRGGVPPGGPGGRGAQVDPLVNVSNANTPLASKLLAVPALRTRYLGYVRDIAEKWLDWNRLGPVAHAYHDLIDADVKRETRKLDPYDDFAATLENGSRASLKDFAEQRRAYLLGHPEIKALPATPAP